MDKIGQQFLLDLFGCPVSSLNNEKYLIDLMRRAIELSGLNIIGEVQHRFHPFGVTASILVEGGHMSIHTWPEHKFCSIDLLTGGDVKKARQAIKEFCLWIGAERIHSSEFSRGEDIKGVSVPVRSYAGEYLASAV